MFRLLPKTDLLKKPRYDWMVYIILVYITRKAKASIATQALLEGSGTKSRRNMLIFDQTWCKKNFFPLIYSRVRLKRTKWKWKISLRSDPFCPLWSQRGNREPWWKFFPRALYFPASIPDRLIDQVHPDIGNGIKFATDSDLGLLRID